MYSVHLPLMYGVHCIHLYFVRLYYFISPINIFIVCRRPGRFPQGLIYAGNLITLSSFVDSSSPSPLLGRAGQIPLTNRKKRELFYSLRNEQNMYTILLLRVTIHILYYHKVYNV